MRWIPMLLCALALLTAIPAQEAAAQSVAIVASCTGENCDDVREVLQDTRRFARVDIYNINARLPELDDLNPYDSVLVFTDENFDERDALGDLLADFVDRGRGVVTAPLAHETGLYQLRGRYYTERYSGLIYSDTIFQDASMGETISEGHPVMRNVQNLESGRVRSSSNAIWTGSYRVANWNDGRPIAVAREDRGGRTLDVTFFPVSDEVDSRNWPRDSDGATFWANALLWASRNLPPSLTIGDPIVAMEGSQTMASVTATDPNGDELEVRWDLDGDGAQDDARGFEVMIPTLDGPASYGIEVSVNDGFTSVFGVLPVEVMNAPPVVDSVSWSEDDAVEMRPVRFTATASDAAGELDTLTYSWIFPEGTTAEGTEAEHAFGQDGTYQVTLVVEDEDDGAVRRNVEVVVRNAPPTLTTLEVDKAEGDEGATFNFRVVAEDVDPLEYQWDFGDGTGANGDVTPHVYKNDGEYIVVVTVEDDAGGSMVSERAITVNNVAPELAPITAPVTAQTNRPIDFEALATDAGDDELTYTWDFGDGTAPQSGVDLHALSHAFALPGEYTVILTVDDGDGGTDTQAYRLTVEGAAAEDGSRAASGSASDDGCSTSTRASVSLGALLRRR